MEKMNDKLKERLEFLDVLEANVRFLTGNTKAKPETEKKLPTNPTSAKN